MNKSKFKVEFMLKQHTPIIHFQSGQSGATLRATELKPKFDKFLLDRVEDLPYKENANGHKSLDYKVKIEHNFSKATEINSRESLFFGNMGDGDDKKYKNYPNKFKIEFFSFTPKVKKAIENHFEAFLANTNFGTRQSKGYGGFYINSKKFDKTLISSKVYSFQTKNWEKDIKVLYSFLRQGLNFPGRDGTRFYAKPAIFSYAKSKGWTWDKKAIKQEYFSNRLDNQFGECIEYQ
jgi:CRISPR/Cas system CMR-associated protein Cmr1 (group 7 of RAMP superfamily)